MKTLLFWAVLGGLLAFGTPGCGRGGGTVQHGDLSYDASEVFAGTGALPLAKAAGRGDVKEIERQVASGVDVNTIGKHAITPLWWAAWAGNYEGFAALLDKGANPNVQRPEYPIMYLVAGMDDPRFLEAALKHGGDPNLLEGVTGNGPLWPAVRDGLKTQIDLLLAAGADVNVQAPTNGQTLPMLALGARKDYELAYRLLQAGADPKIKAFADSTLADTIELVSLHASNNDDPWRKKVIEFLKTNGITVKEPIPSGVSTNLNR